MSAMPKITVMMPAYNAEKYIGDSLRSVLRQDYEDMEVIVVDDCSTDNTYEVAAGFKKDPRVRLYRNRKRLGDYQTRNRILELARGKYVAPHDADDIMLQGRLRRHVAFLEKNPNIGAVFGSLLEADEKLTKLADAARVENCGKPGAVTRMPGLFSHCAATIVKKHMIRAGGYDSESFLGGDTSLFLRLFKRIKFYFLNRPCFIYRIYSKSKTQRMLVQEAETYKRVFSSKQVREEFLATIGNRRVVINKVTREAIGTFQWRLAFYNRHKMRNIANNRDNPKMKWDLPDNAASADSDAERFRRGFLAPFSEAVSRHKQVLVRAALVSCNGRGTLFFAADTTNLTRTILPLILQHRYTYHSIEAPILFLKEGKAYGESLILPVILTRGCGWVRQSYKRRLFWNPLLKKYFFDFALSSPHLVGKQCRITTMVLIRTERERDKISVKYLPPTERYNLIAASVYGKKNILHEQRSILQAVAKQTACFLIKVPQSRNENIVKKLVELTMDLPRKKKWKS